MKFKIYSLYKVAFAICILGGLTWWFTSTEATNTTETERTLRTMPEERLEFEFEMLRDPITGEIPKGVYQKSLKAALKVPGFKLRTNALEKSLPSITVTSKGPNNYGGRTRALGFDTRNSNIIISGGVSAGIFRSTNGGTTWTRVTPTGQIHNLTCLAQDPSSKDTWYAGTGEKLGNSAGSNYYGFGIWKSVDNGVTWTVLTSTQGNLQSWESDFDYVSRIVVDPAGAILACTGESINRSTDGGTTWSVVSNFADGAGNVGDIIYNTAGSKFYAAINGEAGTNPGIWSSADGIAWTQIRTPTDLYSHGVKRIILSNIANTAGILAMYELNTETPAPAYSCSTGGLTSEVGLQGFDGTSTWTDYTDKISNCSQTASSNAPKVISLQGGYNMCMTTKPNDANYVYLGGTEIYRFNLSTNAYEFIGGSQQGANTVNLHVDNHILMFDPNDDDILWAGNDGGLRKTDVTGMIKSIANDPDNGYTWTARNDDYVTYQYYDADISPVNGSSFVGGAAQDNAFTIQPTTAEALEVGPTVDGTSIAILGGTSFANYSILTSWQNGGFVRIDNGTQTDIQPYDRGQGFHSIIYLDADNTSLLYYPYTKSGSPLAASNGLVRTRNASGIADGTISSNPASEWQDMTGINSTLTGSITTMDVSRNEAYGNATYSASNSNRKMYIGTNNGKVYRLNDPAYAAVSTNPVDITPGGISGASTISDIAVNPYNDKEIIVTISNYNTVSVYHTVDASVGSPTWTAVEGPSSSAVELASIRSAMILKSNNTLIYMVGTSTGLYATDALSGATTVWTRVGTNSDIGLALCIEMRLRTSDNKLIVGTHGNGLFLLEFPPALPVDLVTFEGEATDKGNVLTWSTAWEENNKGFDIEKSMDGKRFEKIGFVAGKGTTSNFQNYTFTDKETREKATYYRLKQLDIDGKFEYSKVVVISNKAAATPQLSLYPNPVADNLTIENGIGNLVIRNIEGKTLLQSKVSSNRQNIDVSTLPKGIYIVSIIKTNGSVISRKIVK